MVSQLTINQTGNDTLPRLRQTYFGPKIGERAVLVSPQFQKGSFWIFGESLKRYTLRGVHGQPQTNVPPLGLMGLGRHLRQYYDDVVLVDRNADPRPLETHLQEGDDVFMGGMIAQYLAMTEDALAVKASGNRLVVGGTGVEVGSPLMDVADHAVINEAEMVIDDLLIGMRDGTAEKVYEASSFPTGEEFFLPDFSLIDFRNYVNLAAQLMRGCPENCEFCDITARFGKQPRVTPFAYTADSFQQMYDLGWRGTVFVVDDNLGGNPKRAIDTLKELHALEERIGHHSTKLTELTMRLADDTPIMNDFANAIRINNFTALFIGVETFNTASLEETGKKQNLRGEDTIEQKLLTISEKTGAGVMAGMIYGFDNDTEETVSEQIGGINRTHIPMSMISALMALPNTDLSARLNREGRLMNVGSGDNSDGRFNFIPNNRSARDAEQDYHRILEGVFDKDAYFERVMRELEVISLEHPRNVRTWKESVYSLAKIFSGPHAATYWKHLPQALKIASRRFGVGSGNYTYLISQYVANCARFTHFRAQTDEIGERLKTRKYKPWQEYSWQEIQGSPVAQVRLVEPSIDVDAPSLMDEIAVRLENGYEYVGDRLEALRHFADPYWAQAVQTLKGVKVPTAEQFLSAETRAFFAAHMHKPQILEDIDFGAVRSSLEQSVQDASDYVKVMRHRMDLALHSGSELHPV